MKIIQQSKNNFAPIISNIAQSNVITIPSTLNEITVGSLIGFEKSDDVYHYKYTTTSSNTNNPISLYSDPPNALNFSDWPIVKRNESYNGFARFFVSNGKSTYRSKQLNFITLGSNHIYKVGPITTVPGTYADYSRQRVFSLCNAIPDNRVLENANANDRVNTEIFPHAAFTGVCTHGGWPSQYIGGGIEGRRPIAITKRHVWNCGHYTGDIQVGNILHWKTIDNQTVTRTVIQKINFFTETTWKWDAALYLLDYDLPDTIKPLPIVDDWIYNFLSITDTEYKTLPQCYGLILWGNEGHFSPGLTLPLSDIVRQRNDNLAPGTYRSFEGITLDTLNSNNNIYLGFDEYFWNFDAAAPAEYRTRTNPSDKFYHAVLPGDSGSPIVVPVEDGWALCGIISSSAHCNPETFNALINRLDIRAGISTGYTVAVAPNPLVP